MYLVRQDGRPHELRLRGGPQQPRPAAAGERAHGPFSLACHQNTTPPVHKLPNPVAAALQSCAGFRQKTFNFFAFSA